MKLTIATLALFATTTAFASTTGTVTIQGSIPAVRSIEVQGQGSYNALDLTGNTTNSNYLVANVREKSNATTGYKVTLASANAGNLKHATSNDKLAYTATYNGTAVTLATNPINVTTVTSQTAVVNTVKAFRISYTAAAAPEELLQGTYADTLTFTIAAP